MLILDDDALYVDVNDALCRAIERAPEQVVGRRLGFLSPPDQRDEVGRLWAQLMVDRRLVTGWAVPQADGSVVGIEVVATADLPGPGRHLVVCLPPSRPRAAGRMSPRELEVTALLARGLSGEQIAERLYLSPETVRTHIRNAMERMEAHTRAQLVALALEGDLISLYDRPGLVPAARG
jgi:DNA-binding CsgD family transcriptional regulator